MRFQPGPLGAHVNPRIPGQGLLLPALLIAGALYLVSRPRLTDEDALAITHAFVDSPEWLTGPLRRPVSEYDEWTTAEIEEEPGAFLVEGKHILVGKIRFKVTPDGEIEHIRGLAV